MLKLGHKKMELQQQRELKKKALQQEKDLRGKEIRSRDLGARLQHEIRLRDLFIAETSRDLKARTNSVGKAINTRCITLQGI